MPRKQRRHHRAPPREFSQTQQDEEQQRRVERVKHHVHQMLRARVGSPELMSQNERQIRDRMPVGRHRPRHRPGQTVPVEAAPDFELSVRNEGSS